MAILIRELHRISGWLLRGVLSHEGKTSGLVLSLSKNFRKALEREREREKQSASYVFWGLFVPL